MGNLKINHLVEAGLWLGLVVVLYWWSFGFDREIEIYRFGATGWPRAILILIALAAVGQLAYHWKVGDSATDSAAINTTVGEPATADDNVATAITTTGEPTTAAALALANTAAIADNPPTPTNWRWYASVLFLLSLPILYLWLPAWLVAALPFTLHAAKITAAVVLLAVYFAAVRRYPVGAILAWPVFFGVLLQDFGFYSLAPFFAAGVMLLMGERRAAPVALVSVGIFALLLMLFVSLLYVGLPTGNLSPFYDFGSEVVRLLQ